MSDDLRNALSLLIHAARPSPPLRDAVLVVERALDALTRERDICAEKHCERPTDYGATYNVGGVRVEMYLCEEHFDALGERVLDDNLVAERDQWESQNERLGFQLMDIAAERDTLAEMVRLGRLSVSGDDVLLSVGIVAITPDQAERFRAVLDRITKETSDDE